METNKLYALADRHGITVDRYALNECVSVSAQYGGKQFIALNEGITNADERVCLAHELGHCVTLSFYNIYSPFDVREKHERRANVWAIKKLVPKKRLESEIRKGYDNPFLLSERFDVTVDFMTKALKYYNKI